MDGRCFYFAVTGSCADDFCLRCVCRSVSCLPKCPSFRRGLMSLSHAMPFVRCSVSPALPAGLALNALSGTISGTPTAVSALATYTGERVDHGLWLVDA